MKAVKGIEGRRVAVVELDEPPGSGELIDVRSTSVCASDLLYLRLGVQRVMGHELAGVRADGTPVVVEAIYGCGECEQCLAGHANLCPTMAQRALGATIDGGMAESFRVPAANLVPLPAGLDVRDASLVEPTSVSLHALHLGGVGPGKRVAVVGAGALGLLAAACARHLGADEVAIEARHEHQRLAAERLGAKVGTSGVYDVVIEAAGSPEALSRCGELVAPSGSIVVVGVHSGTLEVDWSPLFHREARLMPSLGYCVHEGRREMAEAAAMLAADPEIPAAIITHRFGIDDAVEAFRVATDRSAGVIRVTIEPS